MAARFPHVYPSDLEDSLDSLSLTETGEESDFQSEKDVLVPPIDLVIPIREKCHLERIPEPELTPAEKQLPKDERSRRSIAKKCQLMKCYNFYNEDFLLQLLSPPNRKVTGRYQDVFPTEVTGPESFYINWVADLDKIFLMTTWITAEIVDEAFFVSKKPSQELVGQMVAALYPPTGRFYRARVLECSTGKFNVTVFYVDNGRIGTVEMDRVRKLPAFLAPLPDYAIRCKLAHVNFSCKNVRDDETRHEFIYELTNPDRDVKFQCKVVFYDADVDFCSVKINIMNTDGTTTRINSIVREKYRNQQNIMDSVARMQGIPKAELEEELLHRNTDVNVPYFSIFHMKGLRAFHVIEAQSPSEMSVQFVTAQTQKPGETGWQQELQDYYNARAGCFNHLCTARPLYDRCYVARHRNHGWQRCRVIRRLDHLRLCDILLLDLALRMQLTFEQLYELNPKFTNVCALGFKAYVVDVRPCNGVEHWSEEVSTAFNKKVKGKVFHSVIIERQEPPVGSHFPQLEGKIGIIMIEKTDEAQETFRMTINAELCIMGWAEPAGIAAASPFFGAFKETDLEYQAMKVAVLNENPYMAIDNLGDTGEDSPRTNVKSLSQLKEVACAMLLTTDTSSAKGGVGDLPDNTNNGLTELPEHIRRSMGTCIISYVVSPACFYVHLHNRLQKLRQMMRYIGQQVAPEPPIATATAGMTVAVFLYDEKQSPTWYRGVVIVPLPNIQLAKVILVDYGTEVSIRYNSMRELPEYFRNIPGFAQRVHLDVPHLLPTGGTPGTLNYWSSDAIDGFRKYMNLWQSQNPLYYFWRPPHSTVVELDTVGQNLEFHGGTSTWTKRVPGVPEMEADLYGTVTTLDLTRPLTRNLCRSVGIDLVFEVLTNESTPYKFEKIAEVLVKKGLAFYQYS